MSTGAHPVPHRVHWLHRWVVWLLVGLVAAAGIGVGIDRAFFSGQAQYSWPPEPCVVQGIDARCGTFVVPENRTKPNGRTIGLHVVVLPAFSKPVRKGRGHVPRRRAGGRRHRGGGQPEPAVERAEPVSRHPARRPARHRGIEPARRRRDPVRDADGDGRPGRGAGGARLPAARRDRQLLRRHRGAGLPEAPSLLGAHAHPRWCNRDRRPLLRPVRGQRPARPRPAREALRLGPRLPEGVPRLGAPVRRAREGVERPPGARHDGRRVRLRRARDAARRDEGGLDPAGRQQRREGRLRAPRSTRTREISTSS